MSDDGKAVYRMSGRFIKVDRIGDVGEGERTNFHFVGDVEGAEISGTVRGIDYALAQDGIVRVHVHETLSTDRDEKLSIERTAVSVRSPEPGRVLITDGECRVWTSAPRLRHLQNGPLRWRAELNWSSVEFSVEVFSR